MDERHFFLLATVLYAMGTGLSIRLFFGHQPELRRVNYGLMLTGFLFHFLFLVQRGKALGHCPLTNLFETMAFITWSAVLIYLLIGTAYRLSLLGAFTAPFATIVNLFAFTGPFDVRHALKPSAGYWAELHAPMAVMAYGAFALSAATGVMFLLQERQLKTHKFSPWFYLLPAVQELEKITFRLMLLGYSMFTVGLAAGFVAGFQRNMDVFDIKTGWSLLVWLLYGLLLIGQWTRRLRGKKAALTAMVLFGFVMFTFWGVYLLSEVHR